MKKALVILSALILGACGGNSSDSSDKGDGIGDGSGNQQLSLTLQSVNQCGQSTHFTAYEVLAYDDNGDIISRSLPDASGKVSANFDRSHINLLIVRDSGSDNTDKKDLEISAFAQLPVGDLGTFDVRVDDITGCQCQTGSLVVQPGGLTVLKQNLPYISSSASTQETRFGVTKFCTLPQDRDAMLVVNHLDSDNGAIYYQSIENPGQQLVDGELLVQVTQTGQVGRGITVNSTHHGVAEIRYVTDQQYNYAVPDRLDSTAYVLDHDRIEKIEYQVSRQLDSDGALSPQGFWIARVPLSDDMVDLSYSKPDYEPGLLSGLMENPSTAYNLTTDHTRVVSATLEYIRPDGSEDYWRYIMPSESNSGFNFVLPEDYLSGVDSASAYRDLIGYRLWMLHEIPALNDLDEVYQSDWLKVLDNDLTNTWQRPPAAFTSVALESLD